MATELHSHLAYGHSLSLVTLPSVIVIVAMLRPSVPGPHRGSNRAAPSVMTISSPQSAIVAQECQSDRAWFQRDKPDKWVNRICGYAWVLRRAVCILRDQ